MPHAVSSDSLHSSLLAARRITGEALTGNELRFMVGGIAANGVAEPNGFHFDVARAFTSRMQSRVNSGG